MRSTRFEIVRIILSVIGVLLLVGIAFRLLFEDSAQASQMVGWGIILLLMIGMAGMLRPRKKK